MAWRDRRLEAAIVAALLLFAVFAADLLLGGPITRSDPVHSLWLRAQMHPRVTQAMLLVTQWHGTTGILVMSALLGVGLAAAGRAWLVPWLLLTVQGGQLLNVAAKQVFQRARPVWDEPILTLTTYSFPSGHAVASTVFWGFVCVVAWNWPASPGVRRACATAAVVLVSLACFSRVYLGAHYLSDVLAGISEGIAWLCACVLARRALTMRS